MVRRRQSHQCLLRFVLTSILSLVLHSIHAPYAVASAAGPSIASKCSLSNGTRNFRDVAYRLSKRDVSQQNLPMQAPVSGRKCLTDAQCVAYRTELLGNHAKSNAAGDSLSDVSGQQQKSRLGEFACVDGTCRYLVKAGELCFSSNDCAAFQLSRRWEQPSASGVDAAGNSTKAHRRQTESLPDDRQSINNSGNDNSWCAPEFCTLEATCGGAWTLPGAPDIAPPGVDSNKPITNGTISCCQGFLVEAQCGLYSGVVDTCSSGYNCATSSAANGAAGIQKRTGMSDKQLDQSLEVFTPTGKCVSQEPHQQVWIGVLLVLIGGATLNIGLNLQKYAFRKRQEKMEADAADAATAAMEATIATTEGRNVHSPLGSGEVVFYSSDGLNKTKTCHDQPSKQDTMRKLPRSADDIYSSRSHHENASDAFIFTQNHAQPGGESILATAEEASMSRIPLASNKERADVSFSKVHMPQKKWRTHLYRIFSHRCRRQRSMPIGNTIWIIGLSIFILGNVINFVALQFAPQSLVAPLGAVSLVTNVIIAPLLNKERITLFDIGGIVLIIAGCVVVVVFSGIVQQNYRLCVLVQLLKAKPTVVYLCLIFAAILAIYSFLWSVERGVERYQNEYDRINDNVQSILATRALGDDAKVESQKPAPQTCILDAGEDRISEQWHKGSHPLKVTSISNTYGGRQSFENIRKCQLHSMEELQQCGNGATNNNLPYPAFKTGLAGESQMSSDHALREANNIKTTAARAYIHTKFGKLCHLLSQHPLMVLDRFIQPIPPTSRQVRFGLPLAYASLGSFMATLTTLFAKSLVNLLSVSLFDHDNQFNNFLSWAILLITAFTAASQVYWINQGLQRYDALLQVPVFYVVWTVFDIIGGGIYFNEFRFFTTVKYVLFVLGVAVIFSGVGLLANRLKNP
ncbi:hypothetical protein H4R24_005268 [Coemansia sp. RSA 988]|nr:hypothetical protein H4R24_005268 [Coemansia sp. RSA 988]